MNREQKRKIIGVAVISGVILVSVASVGAVKLVNEANATEVNKYVTAKNANYNTTYAVLKTITVNNYGGKGGTSTVEVCNSSSTPHYFFSIDGELQTEDEAKFTVPSRVGSSFKGYVDQDGNQICDSKGVVQMDFDPNYPNNKIANVTAINAKYDKTNDDYQFIALDRNGGTGGPDCIYVERGSTYSDDSFETDIDSIEVPTRTGYNFNGYNSSPGLIVKVDGTLNYSVIKNRYTGSHADYIATAEWIPYTHTVVFDANGGNDAPGNQTKTYGSAITLSSNIPTRTGYTFTGWNTKQDGTGTSYAAGGQYTADQNGGTVTLYAQWTQDLTINLYDEDKTTILSNLTLKDGYFYQDGNKIEKNGSFKVPTKEGYIFKGYYSYGGSNLWIGADGTIENEAQYDAIYNCIVKDYDNLPVFMYAQWGANHTVVLNIDGTDGIGGSYPILKKIYGIPLELMQPTKEGYTFKGWNTQPDGKGKNYAPGELYTTDTEKSKETVELYAQWEGNVYKYTLNKDGGAGGTDTVYCKYGTGYYKDEECTQMITKDNPIEVPTKEGYIFEGYYVEDDNDELKVFDSNGYIEKEGTGAKHYTEEKIFYAKWTAWKHTIKFYANGGTGVPKEQTKIYGQILTLSSTIPTKEGYTFKEWNTKQDGTGTSYQPGSKYTEEQANGVVINLYAQWENSEETRIQTIGLEDGTTMYIYFKDGEVYSDEKCTNPISTITVPTKSGYKFNGFKYNGNPIVDPDGNILVNNIVNIHLNYTDDYIAEAEWIEDEDVAATGIEITPTESEIKVGGTTTITATVKPNNATNKNVTWSSSNTAVATVSNGVVTGKSEGTATITATTEDGNYTAEATITVKKDIEDTEGPIISSVKGEKDSDGKYKVIIKVTDESGIEKILVNGTEITTKDDEGNFYFIPTQNGEYKIEAYDTVNNKKEYTYTETRITESGEDNDDNGNAGNNGNNGNTGNSDNDGNNGNAGNTGNLGNGTIGNKNNLNNLNNNGSNNKTGKTGDTITTSTALTELPKTGSTMGVLFAAIASGISAIFAWFKQKKIK